MADAPFELVMPEEFVRIGYSGLFWLAVSVNALEAELWRQVVPTLIRPDGWMALAAFHLPPTVVVVRRDFAAVWDAFTNQPGTMDPPDLSAQLPAKVR